MFTYKTRPKLGHWEIIKASELSRKVGKVVEATEGIEATEPEVEKRGGNDRKGKSQDGEPHNGFQSRGKQFSFL